MWCCFSYGHSISDVCPFANCLSLVIVIHKIVHKKKFCCHCCMLVLVHFDRRETCIHDFDSWHHDHREKRKRFWLKELMLKIMYTSHNNQNNRHNSRTQYTTLSALQSTNGEGASMPIEKLFICDNGNCAIFMFPCCPFCEKITYTSKQNNPIANRKKEPKTAWICLFLHNGLVWRCHYFLPLAKSVIWP